MRQVEQSLGANFTKNLGHKDKSHLIQYAVKIDMKKIYDEQKFKILNKGRIQPCPCMGLSHSNPNPGSHKTLKKK